MSDQTYHCMYCSTPIPGNSFAATCHACESKLIRFQCALCERTCTTPECFRIDLTGGTKRICNGCHHNLKPESKP